MFNRLVVKWSFNLIISFEENISKIYEIFKDYSVGSEINFSQEYAHDIQYRLINNPLKTLSSEDIRDYLGSPKSTIYDESEIKYFLPRILELFVLGENISIVDIDVFRICEHVKNWRLKEKNILSKFSADYFNFIKSSDLDFDILSLFYIFRFPVFNSEQFFELWMASNDVQSLILFSNMLSKNNYFKYYDDEISSKILRWIKSERTKLHFENLIFSQYLDQIDEIDDTLSNQIDYLSFFFKENASRNE